MTNFKSLTKKRRVKETFFLQNWNNLFEIAKSLTKKRRGKETFFLQNRNNLSEITEPQRQ